MTEAVREECGGGRAGTVAQVIEAITRASTETDSVKSLRDAVKRAGIGESKAYRALRRAGQHGFRLGLSLDLGRAEASLAGVWYPEATRYAPSTIAHLVIGGRRMAVVVESSACRVANAAWRVRFILLSRPALATSCYPLSSPPDSLSPSTVKALRDAFYEAFEGPFRQQLLVKRKVGVDLMGLSVLINLALDARVSVSRVAKALGLNERTMQRRVRSMWRRGVILGYGVLDAPYMTRGMTVLFFDHDDNHRLAYSAAVMPPVAYASVIETEDGVYTALGVRAPKRVADQVTDIVRGVGGRLVRSRFFDELKLPAPITVLRACR